MQEVGQVPLTQQSENVKAENQQPVVESEIKQPPIIEFPKEHETLRKILNTSSWFVLFAFLPVTVLILLSQNTIPGDLFYPIKRGMENVVLAAASVSPATRVAFRTDLTQKRFDEAQALLLARADTSGLSDFIKEVRDAQAEVANLSNEDSKSRLTENLIKKIDEYQTKLVLVEAKTTSDGIKPQTSQIAQASATNIPVPTSSQLEPTPTKTSKITSDFKQNPTRSAFAKPSPTIVISPTLAQQIIPTQSSIVKHSATLPPKSASIPTIEPSPTEVKAQPSPTTIAVIPVNPVGTAIDNTKKELEDIKKQLEARHRMEILEHKKDTNVLDHKQKDGMGDDNDHENNDKKDDGKNKEEDEKNREKKIETKFPKIAH